jgi:hypothetical protein
MLHETGKANKALSVELPYELPHPLAIENKTVAKLRRATKRHQHVIATTSNKNNKI